MPDDKRQNVTTSFTLPWLEWINIPVGSVTLERGYIGSMYSRDLLGTYSVAPFAIAKYPVTNAQFQAFILDEGYSNDRWWEGLAKRIQAPQKQGWMDTNHPRETVTWYEAVAFSRWLAHKTALAVTLPTEIQWQWAAVGDTSWEYPYGKMFDNALSNSAESGMMKTTPVDFYDSKLKDKTNFGVMDLSGNVWEWCLDSYETPEQVVIGKSLPRAVRGGSWYSAPEFTRATYRHGHYPDDCAGYIGFRIAVNSPV